jgi:hypothetical protein
MTGQAEALNRDCRSTLNDRTRSWHNRRFAVLLAVLFLSAGQASLAQQRVQEEDFYPAWAAQARYLQPLLVLDTDSALGRRNLHPKLITLKDMAADARSSLRWAGDGVGGVERRVADAVS